MRPSPPKTSAKAALAPSGASGSTHSAAHGRAERHQPLQTDAGVWCAQLQPPKLGDDAQVTEIAPLQALSQIRHLTPRPV